MTVIYLIEDSDSIEFEHWKKKQKNMKLLWKKIRKKSTKSHRDKKAIRILSPKKICILPTNPIGNALKRSQSEVKAGWSPLKLYNDPTRILTKPSKLNSDSKRRKRGKERKRERERWSNQIQKRPSKRFGFSDATFSALWNLSRFFHFLFFSFLCVSSFPRFNQKSIDDC